MLRIPGPPCLRPSCPPCQDDRLAEAIHGCGLRFTRGDRFYHLMGPHDKGRAVRCLIACYRWRADVAAEELNTVAIGNSLNDPPMLEAVDRPFIVQLTDG